MSSKFQPSDPHSENTELSSLHMKLRAAVATTTTETHDTRSPQRFSSLTLDELSEELNRRTKETQRLQEEVENATKVALERFGCTYDISSTPEHSGYEYELNVDGSLDDSTILSAHHQTGNQPLICSPERLSQEVNTRGKEVLENVLDDCLQQMSNLQLNKMCDQPEQETFDFDKAIMDLQIKLQKVQIEKNVLSDLRMKDSRKHVDQMEKMLRMLEEIRNIKSSEDQKLQKTENETLALNRKVETLELNIKDLYHTLLSHEKQCAHKSITIPKVTNIPRKPPLAVNGTEDHYEEKEELQEKHLLSVEHLGNEQCNGVNTQKERMEQLIASLGQEVAMLTDKLSTSKDSGISLSVKLELLKRLAEGQRSLHQRQVSELESTVTSHKDKVCRLEQQLIQAQSQLVNVQREKERSLQQTEELRSQLGQLKLHYNLEVCNLLVKELKTVVETVKEDCQAQTEVQRCSEQQQCEFQEEVKVLRGELEVAREQLHRAGEEKKNLVALLDQRAQEGRKSQEEELQRRQQEAEQHLARLKDAQSQCQILHAERETLRLTLSEREKMVEILRLQMENSSQMTVQHSHTIDTLHQENSLLNNQLNQHKLEIQQLRAELDYHKSDLATAEHERCQLQASVTEQTRQVREESLEKQHLTTRLEVHRVQLLTLNKEHKELQRLHSCKIEEHEGVVLKLQSQLKNAQAELDQVRSTLRTLQGADGHGLQVAMGMQKEITARREEVDSLHSRIQHLEETVEKLHQEKHYQILENQRQLQELTFVREEKRQLANELEALQSKDTQLRDRISKLEAILHKMSESFTDCQDFIQLQEQEFFRLKLKHALDLKELQGQNLRTAPNVTPPVLDSPTPTALTAPPSSQHVSNTHMKSKQQQESHTWELRSLVKELRGVISENRRPHTDNSAPGNSFHRRRSAPERTAFSADEYEEVKTGSRLRRKTCGSEPHFLKTAELKTISNNSFSEGHLISGPQYTSSPKLHSPGRRSPVHALLTFDPNS